jgi:hypothetical protein
MNNIIKTILYLSTLCWATLSIIVLTSPFYEFVGGVTRFAINRNITFGLVFTVAAILNLLILKKIPTQSLTLLLGFISTVLAFSLLGAASYRLFIENMPVFG